MQFPVLKDTVNWVSHEEKYSIHFNLWSSFCNLSYQKHNVQQQHNVQTLWTYNETDVFSINHDCNRFEKKNQSYILCYWRLDEEEWDLPTHLVTIDKLC